MKSKNILLIAVLLNMVACLCLLLAQTNTLPALPVNDPDFVVGEYTPLPPTGDPPPPLIGTPYSITAEFIETSNGVTRVITTNEVTSVPFLIATGVNTNGRPILEAPPQWMLDGPPDPADHLPFLKVTFYDELTGQPLYSASYAGTNQTSFAKWEVVSKEPVTTEIQNEEE